MRGVPPTGLVAVGLAASALAFLLDLALSVVLVCVGSLSRVALRRLAAESGGALRFLDDVKSIDSSHRIALQIARQMSLLAGSVLVGLSAQTAGWSRPWLLAVLCGGAVGALLLETLAARSLAIKNPRAWLRVSAPFVKAVHLLFYPLAVPFGARMRRSRSGAAPGEDEKDEDADEENVEAFIEVGEREGLLEAGEGRMLRGIMDMGETRVREIMTPRTDIVALAEETTVAEARQAILKSGHSRLPVYRGTIDNVVGILHVRDLLQASEEGANDAPVGMRARAPFFVPETRSTAEALAEMRKGTPIALVVDEYGGLAGLLTIEDVIEEIVGEIREEHEPEDARVRHEPDGSWTISGLAHVEEFEEILGVEVGQRDFDTVGGLVVSAFGRVPGAGESFDFQGVRIEILEADRRRVYRVRAHRGTSAATPEPGGP